MKIIKDLLRESTQKLLKTTSEAGLEAELLLCFALKKEKEYLFQNLDKKILKSIENKFKKLLKKRLTGLPLAYISGKKEFFGLEFKVNQNVLIPRPETEELVDYFLKSCIAKKKNLIIADIGTGCGCIAITVAKKIPSVKVHATDISQNALKVARANAKCHKVLKNIKFLKGNLLSSLPQKVDVIIANLPYVSEKNYQKYHKNLKFEPKRALLGGKDGLFYIKKLLKAAPKHLKAKGEVFLEITPELTQELIQEIKKLGVNSLGFYKAIFKKDLSGKIRILHLKHK